MDKPLIKQGRLVLKSPKAKMVAVIPSIKPVILMVVKVRRRKSERKAIFKLFWYIILSILNGLIDRNQRLYQNCNCLIIR